jgi:hypothetical protein
VSVRAYAAWLAQVLLSSRATPLPVDPLVGQLAMV